jgi:hypothetical protein
MNDAIGSSAFQTNFKCSPIMQITGPSANFAKIFQPRRRGIRAKEHMNLTSFCQKASCHVGSDESTRASNQDAIHRARLREWSGPLRDFAGIAIFPPLSAIGTEQPDVSLSTRVLCTQVAG